MKLDLQELRERCDAAVADHVFVDVRKDELVALLEHLAAATGAIAYALRRAGTDAEFSYHMLFTETFDRLVHAFAKLTGRNIADVRAEVISAAKTLQQSRCASDREFLDGGRLV